MTRKLESEVVKLGSVAKEQIESAAKEQLGSVTRNLDPCSGNIIIQSEGEAIKCGKLKKMI